MANFINIHIKLLMILNLLPGFCESLSSQPTRDSGSDYLSRSGRMLEYSEHLESNFTAHTALFFDTSVQSQVSHLHCLASFRFISVLVWCPEEIDHLIGVISPPHTGGTLK